MLDRLILARSRHRLQALARPLQAAGIRADQVTLAGFLLGISALPALALQQYGLALLLIGLNRLCDGLDGTLARLTRPSDRGGFLDIVLDFLFYSAIPLGFALADPDRNALPAAVLIYSFIGTGCSFLAFAVIAAKRGLTGTTYPDKSFYYLGGLTEATETLSVFALMCLWPAAFPVLAWGFAILCFITTALRLHAGWTLFADQ
ncbi:MAG: CDP-alcohol phosphatidyltransferase family protein [Thiothrix sp.]|nr:CDP-alcohol phosphatidyltransferase family protein [Thiothrix sp.]